MLGDGVVNALVFLIDSPEVVLPFGVGAKDAADTGAWYQACAQGVHQVGEVVILGGAGNFLMELVVGSHRVSALFSGAVKGEQC